MGQCRFGHHHEAVSSGEVALIQSAIAAGADINSTNDFDSTLLIVGAVHNHLNAIQVLLTLGVDLERHDRLAVSALLQAGAQVNATGRQGMTPLMLAAARGDVPMIRLLMEFGADSERRDTKGFIAMDYAIQKHKDQAAAHLAEAGMSPKGFYKMSTATSDRHQFGREL